jgi:hypothetical protein
MQVTFMTKVQALITILHSDNSIILLKTLNSKHSERRQSKLVIRERKMETESQTVWNK